MIDLDELKRLAGLVTPGEWEVDARPDFYWPNNRIGLSYIAGYNISSKSSEVVGCEGIIPGSHAEYDAALICLLRNNLPSIIAALETARLVREVPQTLPAAKLDEVAASAVDWDGSDIPGDEPAKWETEAGVIRDMVAEIRAYRAIIAALSKEEV